VIYETRPLAAVNEAIAEVLHGKAKARLVLEALNGNPCWLPPEVQTATCSRAPP